jgi:hypothetical protein
MRFGADVTNVLPLDLPFPYTIWQIGGALQNRVFI